MKMGSAGVSGRGRAIAIGDQSELYYFGPVLSGWMCLLLLLVSRGNRCGCTAGRVRLIFYFLLASLGHTHNLDLEEGLGPLVGLGFFSSCVSSTFQGC